MASNSNMKECSITGIRLQLPSNEGQLDVFFNLFSKNEGIINFPLFHTNLLLKLLSPDLASEQEKVYPSQFVFTKAGHHWWPYMNSSLNSITVLDKLKCTCHKVSLFWDFLLLLQVPVKRHLHRKLECLFYFY